MMAYEIYLYLSPWEEQYLGSKNTSIIMLIRLFFGIFFKPQVKAQMFFSSKVDPETDFSLTSK